MCMEPVGEGAIRVTTGRSGIELEVMEAGAGAQAGGTARLSNTAGDAAPSLPGLAAWLAEQARSQAGRWTLWTPVALGVGAAVYFALPREPAGWVAFASLAVAAALFWAKGRFAHLAPAVALTLAAFAVAGFGLAKLRTLRVDAPVAAGAGRPQRIEGFVVDVASPGASGPRLLVAPVRIGDWPPEATPIRIRVTLRPEMPIPPPGAAISLLAIVNAPPPPASPGAYDFARDAYFESVGGVGLALSEPRTARLGDPPRRLAWTMAVNAARWTLARRIVTTLGPGTGGLAAAMTTGHEAFIPPAQVEDLRAAGLAHIISISGLHMAIVGGVAFAALRLLIAAWPWLALRLPGKKLAAASALAAIGGYLVLSGAPAPAQRAAITAAVAFGAMLFDRQAVSLHSLALAALIILALQPEAVTEPGFQMSFAATAALVALAELWPRPAREISVPWPIRAVQATGAWILISIAASFIAGLATGPFAIQHFNRVSTWGLAANLAAAPISSFLMMPALALGAALTPLGRGGPPLMVAGWAISGLTWVAHVAAAAPNATLTVASAPPWALPAALLGILWLCLWKGPLRWAGLPFALAVSLAPRPPAPDAWVAADGAAAAVRLGGEAILLRPDAKRFAAELWARRRGLEPTADAAKFTAAFDCDRWSCAPRPDAPKVAATWNLKRPLAEGRFTELCASAEVLVVRNAAPPEPCPRALVLTGADFARGGAAELYRQDDGRWRAVWAQDLRGRRPWSWNWGLSGSGG